MQQLFERTLGGWLEYWAETTPDKEYIVYSDRDLRFTWKVFNERVDNLAKGLLAIGVKKGSNVGIWATNVPDWLTFLYATAKIGAVLGWNISAKTPTCIPSASPTAPGSATMWT